MTTNVTEAEAARAGKAYPDARASSHPASAAPATARPAAAPTGPLRADAGGDEASVAASPSGDVSAPGFLRRYRLPLMLALVATCLYAGSILYILYGRGQIA